MNVKHFISMLIPATLVMAALSACGVSVSKTTIDSGKAEDLVVKTFSGGQVEPKSASCPDDVEAKKGQTFSCDITYSDGTKGVVTIDMTSDDGQVSIKPGAQTITSQP